jgi:hypothetical protein
MQPKTFMTSYYLFIGAFIWFISGLMTAFITANILYGFGKEQGYRSGYSAALKSVGVAPLGSDAPIPSSLSYGNRCANNCYSYWLQ